MGLERLDQVLGGLQQVRGSSLKGFGGFTPRPGGREYFTQRKYHNDHKRFFKKMLNLDAFMR